MGITLIDGGLGQDLLARSQKPPTPLWSVQYLLDNPALITEIHLDNLRAGATMVTTASYVLHHERLKPHNLDTRIQELLTTSCQLAKQAVEQHGSGNILGAIGPTPRSYRPDLAIDIQEAAATYYEIASILAPQVDTLVVETMSSIKMAKGVLEGLKNIDKNSWIAFSVSDDDGTVLRSGEPVEAVLELCSEYQFDALLFNCSRPTAITQAIKQLKPHQLNMPLGAYANGFDGISQEFLDPNATTDALSKDTAITPTAYLEFVKNWLDDGVTIVGGCCEINTDHIAAIHQYLTENELY